MLRSGSGGDEKAAASSLFNTAQKIASQLTPATPVPTPGPTPQANFLNLPNINLQNILGALPGANNGVSALFCVLCGSLHPGPELFVARSCMLPPRSV